MESTVLKAADTDGYDDGEVVKYYIVVLREDQLDLIADRVVQKLAEAKAKGA